MADSQLGVLYNIDPEMGIANRVDLGGELVYGDGLVRESTHARKIGTFVY